jgi:mannose-6-phosphate isomerase-like protein (cupin superfamily)
VTLAQLVAGRHAAAWCSNFGTHREEDEIIFFLRASGRGVIAQDTFPVQPSTLMYVPRGVRHGFINPGPEPLRFFWVVSPAGLAARFRGGARQPGQVCN